MIWALVSAFLFGVWVGIFCGVAMRIASEQRRARFVAGLHPRYGRG